MSLFPETIARGLAGGKVECANLVLFDFVSEPMRLWLGGGTLRTNDDKAWQSIGTLGDMKGIEQAVNGTAPQASFVLSGIDSTVMRIARDEFSAEAKGRIVRVYIQFFGVEDEDDPDNQRCLDLPYPVWAGRMLTPSFALDGGDETSPGAFSVTVSAESIFSLRSRPRWSMYTDADQRHRFPDDPADKGFQFAPTLVNKVVVWPDY